MILLALALQLSASPPLQSLFTYDDVPVRMLRENVVESVAIALTVQPDGRVQSCLVEKGSGNPKLEAYTCKLATRRAKFRPSTNRQGTPVYRVYRTTINWWIGDRSPTSRMVLRDLHLMVSRLPPNVKSPAVINLAFAVDAAGHASDCRGEDEQSHPELVRLGCDELLKEFRPKPATTDKGVPVPSIQSATVLFETS